MEILKNKKYIRLLIMLIAIFFFMILTPKKVFATGEIPFQKSDGKYYITYNNNDYYLPLWENHDDIVNYFIYPSLSQNSNGSTRVYFGIKGFPSVTPVITEFELSDGYVSDFRINSSYSQYVITYSVWYDINALGETSNFSAYNKFSYIHSSTLTDSNFFHVYANIDTYTTFDFLDEQDNVVFQRATQEQGTTVLAPIVAEQEMKQTLLEIIRLLPIVLIVIVSAIAIRKAIQWIIQQIKQA